jgi:hypothetical protein
MVDLDFQFGGISHQARSLYLDGVRDDDPPWAWWINDQELAWHEAMIRADSADWSAAVDALEASLVLTPGREIRRRYNHLANLFYAQVRAGPGGMQTGRWRWSRRSSRKCALRAL